MRIAVGLFVMLAGLRTADAGACLDEEIAYVKMLEKLAKHPSNEAYDESLYCT
jgi:hypothetical protein